MTFTVPPAKHRELFTNGEYLVTKVDHDTVDTLIAWIMSNRPAKKNFTILINSSGGSPSAVIYFASFLATLDSQVKIKGVAFGECGSAALALFQCCHERIAVKHCGFFIHHVNFKLDISCHGYDRQKLEAELEQSKHVEEELVGIQAKRCGMSRREWMKLADEGEEIKGRAILPAKALRLKLIDRIVDRHVIF